MRPGYETGETFVSMMGSKVPDLENIIGSSDDFCPICLEIMPVLTWRGTERCRSVCCGKFVCPECMVDIHDHTRSNIKKAHEAVTSRDQQKASQLLKSVDSMNNCPLCRSKLPRSAEESFACSLQNAKKGNAYAQHSVATKYESGKGTRKNIKEACKWFEAATQQGHPWSPSSYGYILEKGEGGVKKDIVKAKQMYELSMSLDHPIGYYYMGNLYENGIGVKKNEKEAVRLYRIGADIGVDVAQCSLGNCYDFGIGLAENTEVALKWYLLSAEQGKNTTAMMNAGSTMMKIAQLKFGRCDVVGNSPVPRMVYWLKRAIKLGESEGLMIMRQIEDNCKSVCAQCNKSATSAKLTRCSKCKIIHYCSKSCQVAHWKAGQ